jgi:hypothetical protein
MLSQDERNAVFSAATTTFEKITGFVTKQRSLIGSHAGSETGPSPLESSMPRFEELERRLVKVEGLVAAVTMLSNQKSEETFKKMVVALDHF